ncbi:hypothetical protein C8P68_105221 [Mucilaginibacter yixingensis]|uniref:Uncharacterized protein n=1 Tax=Mucilaginibacter yixingensis TaxID=1295612 RepID=A0A2T5J8C2_9SPHI|nr:hypothetical protein [Mucilaginibacter yixingensis]PTQ95713.1 hypothetical protein C8P68_105221 [Mucilaginibacter yixingensis]
MLNKDSLVTGTLIGLVFPTTSVLALDVVWYDPYLNGKPGVPYLIAIALNLLLLKYFAKKETIKTVQGIMAITFVFMLLVFLFRIRA